MKGGSFHIFCGVPCHLLLFTPPRSSFGPEPAGFRDISRVRLSNARSTQKSLGQRSLSFDSDNIGIIFCNVEHLRGLLNRQRM